MSLLPAHPKLRALLDLWNRKRGARPLPSRSDLDVAELSPWLGHLHLVEAVDHGRDFVHRVYGTEIALLFGLDLTGKMMDAVPDAARPQLLEEYREVLRKAGPLLLENDPLVQSTLERVERLVLPLSSDGLSVDRLLIGAFPMKLPDTVPPLSPERRAVHRVVTSLEAVLQSGGDRWVGMVVDYSPRGVRLRLDRRIGGREPLTLAIKGGEGLAARLIWERDGEAGLQFLGGGSTGAVG